MSRMLLIFGGLLLIHSCYASLRYRQYTTLLDEQVEMLPLDIILEALLGCFISCWGTVVFAGDFKPLKISAHLSTKTWDTINHRSSFFKI